MCVCVVQIACFLIHRQAYNNIMYLTFYPLCSQVEVELTSLCQSVLEDFNLVLFYLPAQMLSGVRHSHSEEEEEPQQQQQQQHHVDSCSTVLPDTLIFKMVVICLMVVHSLKRGG